MMHDTFLVKKGFLPYLNVIPNPCYFFMFIIIVHCTALTSTLVVRASLLLTLYKLYTTWHTEPFHCTQPLLLSKDVTASNWSAGTIQPSDWATPRTDTGVGPNNYSLHNNIQPTQHLHFSLIPIATAAHMRSEVWRQEWELCDQWPGNVTWCDGGGTGAGLTQVLSFLRLSQSIS